MTWALIAGLYVIAVYMLFTRAPVGIIALVSLMIVTGFKVAAPEHLRAGSFLAVLVGGGLFVGYLLALRPEGGGTVHDHMIELRGEGNAEEAVKIGERILRDAPDDTRVQLDLIEAYFDIGADEKAARVYGQIQEQDLQERDRSRYKAIGERITG
jgi:hypothetical protein